MHQESSDEGSLEGKSESGEEEKLFIYLFCLTGRVENSFSLLHGTLWQCSNLVHVRAESARAINRLRFCRLAVGSSHFMLYCLNQYSILIQFI
jgi:hypothetical protein